MNSTPLRSCAILSLRSCLTTLLVIAVPAMAQAPGTSATGTQVNIDANDLLQHWVHSSEEEKPGATVRILRPAGSRMFPPSRFRMAYKFARDGACEYYFLSPDDAHAFKPCNWTISARDKTTLQISASGQTTTYRIVQLSAKILRLAPLKQQGGG